MVNAKDHFGRRTIIKKYFDRGVFKSARRISLAAINQRTKKWGITDRINLENYISRNPCAVDNPKRLEKNLFMEFP